MLALAVAASLALHLGLLFVLPLLQAAQRARPAPPSLSARLVKPKPPDPVPPRVEPPVRQAPRPSPPRAAAIAKAAPQLAAPPAISPVPIRTVEPAQQAADPVFVVPQASTAPQGPIARAEPQAAVQGASGPDPGAVARYRLELMDLARRYRKYPRIAQDNNWEGRVELRIEIGADGALAALSVKKGAGRAVLDEAAQAMIRAAGSVAAVPPALRGKAFALEIPVDFLLKDEEK